jgi:hypothetical protein
VNTFYLKNPSTSEEYFGINTTNDNTSQSLILGNFSVATDNTNNDLMFQPSKPNAGLHLNSSNFKYVFLPGITLRNAEKLAEIGVDMVPSIDAITAIGNQSARYSAIFGKRFFGENLAINQNWQAGQQLTPTAAIDIEGIEGFNQFRLRKSYTPTGSGDSNGNVGDISWDTNFIYIKTSEGWKRSSLTAF